MHFQPPDESERIKAIGSMKGLTTFMRHAFTPGDDFLPIKTPEPGDWLAEHPERGQIFSDFVQSQYNKPDAVRRTIYLQPLGIFPEETSPSLSALRDFAHAYFAMDVEVLLTLPLKNRNITTRTNRYTGKRQILTHDILMLLRTILPDDAFCILVITMEDLYPDPSWNFVFGQASLSERIGVFSFARYDPMFYGDMRGPNNMTVLLKRSCKVLAHETAHMFGLKHCIYFQCVMNGSNHLKESDSRPLHLCPLCLRKLHHSLQFDILKRYISLLDFYQTHGFLEEALWVKKRIAYLTQKI